MICSPPNLQLATSCQPSYNQTKSVFHFLFPSKGVYFFFKAVNMGFFLSLYFCLITSSSAFISCSICSKCFFNSDVDIESYEVSYTMQEEWRWKKWWRRREKYRKRREEEAGERTEEEETEEKEQEEEEKDIRMRLLKKKIEKLKEGNLWPKKKMLR